MVVADWIGIYLYFFQERLNCIGNGLQEGALQTVAKDSCSICTDSQTCYNVVQSNLSDSGSRGHFMRCVRRGGIYPVHMGLSLLLATVHLPHWRCVSGVELDHIKCYYWICSYIERSGKKAGLHLSSTIEGSLIFAMISSHALSCLYRLGFSSGNLQTRVLELTHNMQSKHTWFDFSILLFPK
jgi:hypothetical protein